MWQLSPSGSPTPLTDAAVMALDEAVARVEALLDEERRPAFRQALQDDLTQLQGRREDVAGRLAALRQLAEDAPEIARKGDLYGEAAFYRRGAPMTISQTPGECAVLGARSPGMERVK